MSDRTQDSGQRTLDVALDVGCWILDGTHSGTETETATATATTAEVYWERQTRASKHSTAQHYTVIHSTALQSSALPIP